MNGGGGKRRGRGGGGGSTGGTGDVVEADPCDLNYTVPLQGVRRPAIDSVKLEDLLPVELRGDGNKTSVVCVLPGTSEVVGALTMIGIGTLMTCIQKGNRYVGKVMVLSGSDCKVWVHRSVAAPT